MKTKKAAGRTAATKSKLLNTLYDKAVPKSSLTSEIGTLLLCLQFPVEPELSHVGWELFERLLRMYIELKYA